MGMIETVARALYRQEFILANLRPPTEAEIDQAWFQFTDHARAALWAMREPTKLMLDEAMSAMSPGKRPTEQRVSNSQKYRIRYHAMIDAALGNTRTLPMKKMSDVGEVK